MDTYTHVMPALMRDAADAMDRALQIPGALAWAIEGLGRLPVSRSVSRSSACGGRPLSVEHGAQTCPELLGSGGEGGI